MSIKLIAIPGHANDMPRIGQASLYAYLCEKGIDASQRDYNALFLHYLINDGRVPEIASRFLRKKRKADEKACLSNRDLELFAANNHANVILKQTAMGNPSLSIDDYLEGHRVFVNFLQLLCLEYGPAALATIGVFDRDYLSSIHSCIENLDTPFIREFYRPFLDSQLGDYDGVDLVGMSIISARNLYFALVTARHLREYMPDLRIVVGGPLITPYFKYYAHLKALRQYFDFIIAFEGESALCELHENLDAQSRWPSMPNLLYPCGDGYGLSESRHLEDIDSLPTPRFDGLPLDLYFTPEVLLPLVISKSCPYKCAFCGYNSNFAGKYRERSPERILDDIATLKRLHNVKTLSLSTSYLNPKFALAIAEGLIEHKLDVNWLAQTRPEREFIKDGVLETLRESGCVALQFGVESASQRVLGLMNKTINIKDVPQILKRCDRLGILKYVFVIFGFPGERFSELSDTIEFMKEHHRIVDFYSVADFQMEFKSLVWRYPDRYGVTINYTVEEFLQYGINAVDFTIKRQTDRYRRKREMMARRCFDWFERRGFIITRDKDIAWSGLPPALGWSAYASSSGLYRGPGS